MSADGLTVPNPLTDATSEHEYADALPVGCPPCGAVQATGTFFATHKMSPPTLSDFPTAATANKFRGLDECKRNGNSIMESIDDARQLCAAHPDVHVYVSEGVLTNTHGRLIKDKTKKYPSHHTLWRYKGVTMQSIFTKVV